MTPYYVDPVGGDDTTGDGLTLGTAFETIAHALTVAVSGDQIILTTGTHTLSATLQPTQDDLTIKPVAGFGSKPFIDYAPGNDAFLLTSLTNFRIEDLRFSGGDSTIVLSTSSNGLRVVRCEAAGTSGTFVQAISGLSGTDNLVVGCDGTGSGVAGADGVAGFGTAPFEVVGGSYTGYNGAGSDGLTNHETSTMVVTFGVFEGVYYPPVEIDDCNDGIHFTNTSGTNYVNGARIQNCVDACIKHQSTSGSAKTVITNTVLVNNSASGTATSGCVKSVGFGNIELYSSVLDNQLDSVTTWALHANSLDANVTAQNCIFTGALTNNARYIRFATNNWSNIDLLDNNTFHTKVGSEFNAGGSLGFSTLADLERFTYTGGSGTPAVNETLTGATSGATATVASFEGTGSILVRNISGTFQAGETVSTASLTGATLGALPAGKLFEANGQVADPLLVGSIAADYANANVQAGSPCIDFGADLTGVAAPYTDQDHRGWPRPTGVAWTGGAFQVQLATKLAYDTPPTSPVTVNATWPTFEVSLRDAGDQLIANENQLITITLDSGSGVLGGTLSKLSVAGVATFDDLTYDTAEPITIDVAPVTDATTLQDRAVTVDPLVTDPTYGDGVVTVAGSDPIPLFDPQGLGSPGVLDAGLCVEISGLRVFNTTNTDAVLRVQNPLDGSLIGVVGLPANHQYGLSMSWRGDDGQVPEFLLDVAGAITKVNASYRIVACPTQPEASMDIIVIAGADQAVGLNDGPIDIAGADAIDPNVFQLGQGVDFGNYFAAANSIVPAQHPLQHRAQAAHSDTDYEVSGQSQLVGFGLALGKRYAALRPGRKVLLIPCAEAGSSLESGDWSKGGTLYAELVARVNAAISRGHRLAGMVWWQGRNDSENAGALPLNTASADDGRRYGERFARLLANLRRDLTPDSDGNHHEKPVLVVQASGDFLTTFSGTGTTRIDEFQQKVANEVPAGKFVANTVGGTWVIDTADGLGVNVDAATQRALGTAMADLLLAGTTSELKMRVHALSGALVDDFGGVLYNRGTGTVSVVTDGDRGDVMSWPDDTTALRISTALPVNPVRGYTKMCWFKGTVNGASIMHLISSVDPTAAHQFALQVRASHNDLTPTAVAIGGASLDGDWHHLALKWTGAQFRIHIDGVFVAFTAANGGANVPNSVRIAIGAISVDGGQTFEDGIGAGRLLDDVRVYDRALTDAEILGIYTLTNAPVG